MAKSAYTVALAEQICQRIAEGEPLRVICRDEGMPAWRTVYDWIEAEPGFAARIARAREAGHDAIAQQSMDIVDSEPERAPDGRIDPASVQLNKLRAEHRLKLLAKWSPKKYGDKVQVGGDADNPLVVVGRIEREIIDKVGDGD